MPRCLHKEKKNEQCKKISNKENFRKEFIFHTFLFVLCVKEVDNDYQLI